MRDTLLRQVPVVPLPVSNTERKRAYNVRKSGVKHVVYARETNKKDGSKTTIDCRLLTHRRVRQTADTRGTRTWLFSLVRTHRSFFIFVYVPRERLLNISARFEGGHQLDNVKVSDLDLLAFLVSLLGPAASCRP